MQQDQRRAVAPAPPDHAAAAAGRRDALGTGIDRGDNRRGRKWCARANDVIRRHEASDPSLVVGVLPGPG